MSSLREIAVRPGNTLDAVWEIYKERDCDPHPGKYSMRHSNGALHREFRAYDKKGKLIDDAKEADFRIILFGECHLVELISER